MKIGYLAFMKHVQEIRSLPFKAEEKDTSTSRPLREQFKK